MVIRKGESWGVVASLPPGSPIVRSDASAAALLHAGVAAGVPAIVGLTAGSLWELLGAPGNLNLHEAAMTFPVDLGIAMVSGREFAFLGSVRAWTASRRTGLAALNGQMVDGLRLGHRGHINDGRLDIVQWNLRWSELLAVRARARSGSHTPHPRIVEQRVANFSVSFSSSRRIIVDGALVGSSTDLRLRIVPDAGFVVV